MKLEIVTVMSRVPDRNREPYYHYDAFIDGLRRFDVAPTILGLAEPWGGLMTKPRRLRQWLRDGRCRGELVCASDAWDVVWTVHPDDVAASWHGGDEVMFNAERALFPRGDLAHAFPDTGTPWRYLNSGIMIGKPDRILALLEGMNLDDLHDDYISPDELHGGTNRVINTNDQGWYQFAYAARIVPMILDTRCELFQSCSGCTLDDFDLSGVMPSNRITDTHPLVWHFNGGAKNDLMPVFLQRWGLS